MTVVLVCFIETAVHITIHSISVYLSVCKARPTEQQKYVGSSDENTWQQMKMNAV